MDTKEYAKHFLEKIMKLPENEDAFVVGLSGHLGAGKTAFTKEIARIMGVKQEITSPTFVIMKIYETQNERWPRLIHIDAYRLERGEELQAIDFERLVSDKRNLILIEWPENVEDIVSSVERVRLHISINQDESRVYEEVGREKY
jgi:tRNA threonylcarbamoyladenosine biosynthesis protein TsaE